MGHQPGASDAQADAAFLEDVEVERWVTPPKEIGTLRVRFFHRVGGNFRHGFFAYSPENVGLFD